MGKRAVLNAGEKKMCAYKEQYPEVWLYFEQNLVSKGVIQGIVALDIAIGKINEKKIQTNGSACLVPKMRL